MEPERQQHLHAVLDNIYRTLDYFRYQLDTLDQLAIEELDYPENKSRRLIETSRQQRERHFPADYINQPIRELIHAIQNMARQVKQSSQQARRKGEEVYEDTKDRAQDFYERAADKAQDVYEDVRDYAEDVYETSTERVSEAYDKVRDVFDDATRKGEKVYEKTKRKTSEKADDVYENVADSAKEYGHQAYRYLFGDNEEERKQGRTRKYKLDDDKEYRTMVRIILNSLPEYDEHRMTPRRYADNLKQEISYKMGQLSGINYERHQVERQQQQEQQQQQPQLLGMYAPLLLLFFVVGSRFLWPSEAVRRVRTRTTPAIRRPVTEKAPDNFDEDDTEHFIQQTTIETRDSGYLVQGMNEFLRMAITVPLTLILFNFMENNGYSRLLMHSLYASLVLGTGLKFLQSSSLLQPGQRGNVNWLDSVYLLSLLPEFVTLYASAANLYYWLTGHQLWF